jgi:hypothetical protein
MIRISTGTEITLIARIALHLSYSDLTTPKKVRYIPLTHPTRSKVKLENE